MKGFVLAALIAVASLPGCSSPTLTGGENLSVVNGSALPPPAKVDFAAPERGYLIGPFDKLSIEVFGVEELSRTMQVDATGRIALPLAGPLEAAGKTTAELAEEVESSLRRQYVRDPQVTVNLIEAVSQVITLDGEVKEPGLYPVIGRMTLLRAIASAKGTTEFARQSHVVVFRTVEKQKLAALYDLRAIRSGVYPDPEVYANDVVVVGESQARRIFRDVIQGSGLLTAPLIAVLQ